MKLLTNLQTISFAFAVLMKQRCARKKRYGDPVLTRIHFNVEGGFC
jgi:hypothetical protein